MENFFLIREWNIEKLIHLEMDGSRTSNAQKYLDLSWSDGMNGMAA